MPFFIVSVLSDSISSNNHSEIKYACDLEVFDKEVLNVKTSKEKFVYEKDGTPFEKPIICLKCLSDNDCSLKLNYTNLDVNNCIGATKESNTYAYILSERIYDYDKVLNNLEEEMHTRMYLNRFEKRN